jgi:hypothetical protein
MVWKLRVPRCGSAQRVLAAAALIVITSLPVAAAETSLLTDAERLYQQTRKSSDRSTKLLGQRWYGLVQRQEWTDATGKFTTTARYLAHDPDLRWVKLRAERTTNGHRETKEVTVPYERLSKMCQSRVRQINVLEPKVREAAAAAIEEAQTRAEERERDRQGDRPASDGREEGDARSDEPAAEPPPAESWPTSYEAFRANFSVEQRDGRPQVDWGTLRTLQQVHDVLYNADGQSHVPGPLEATNLALQMASVGEFTWEAELTRPVADDDEWADRLDLPPLPEPLSLQLVLDQDSGDWQRLRVGDRVRLTGRFTAFAGQYKIVAAIRFPERTRPR